MTRPSNGEHRVDEEDVARLARFASLDIPAERVPPVTQELNAILALMTDLPPIVEEDLAPATETFDPAWPEASGKRR